VLSGAGDQLKVSLHLALRLTRRPVYVAVALHEDQAINQTCRNPCLLIVGFTGIQNVLIVVLSFMTKGR